MTKPLSLLLACLLFNSLATAQVITLYGKVTDSKTSKAVPGASVRVGKLASSTNNLGEFTIVLSQPEVIKYGITVTSIGYQSKHIAYQQNGTYAIVLIPAALTMLEVKISAPAESIIQKAIRKIPQNYPDKDFTMQGILRIHKTTKDSLGTYMYYKNDAVIRMYYPSYTKSGDIQVSLIQNRFNRLKNSVHDADTVRWVNGYLLVPDMDIVHGRYAVASLSGLKQYTYTNQGKTNINNTRVYQISFYSKNISGTVYIDTASYAFVNTSYTRYNIKRLGFVTIDKATSTINYKKRDGKWYLNDVKTNRTGRHSGLTLDYIGDYQTTGIDTTKAEAIAYQDRVQNMSETIKINKTGTDADWEKYKSLFEQGEKDTMITNIATPVVDTTPKKPTGSQKVLGSILTYLRNDNIRYSLQLSRLPLNIDFYQPVLSKNIGSASPYAFEIGMQFRLYKGLFVSYGSASNYGIGGIKAEANNYLLTYNFEFNKKHHPITLSPVFGYNELTLKSSDTEYFKQKSLAYGLTFAYELKRSLSLFAGVNYLDPMSTYNGGILLNAQRLYPSFGILYKLK